MKDEAHAFREAVVLLVAESKPPVADVAEEDLDPLAVDFGRRGASSLGHPLLD